MIKIIIESVLNRRADGKLRFRPETLNGLRHYMRCGVSVHQPLFFICKINHKIPLSPYTDIRTGNKKSHAVYNYMGCITHGSTQIVFPKEDLSTDDNAVGGTSYLLRGNPRKLSLCDSGVVCT
jgi:hypothetical protein